MGLKTTNSANVNKWYYFISFGLFYVSTAFLVILEGDLNLLFIPWTCLVVFGGFSMLLLKETRVGLLSFLIPYSIGTFWILVSSYYRLYLNDPAQNELDAFFFYEVSSQNLGIPLNELILYTEGSLAVFVWEKAYYLTGLLGLGKPVLMGLVVNNSIVALTAVIGIKTISLIYKNDAFRNLRYILLFSGCAMFWLFSSLHVRDCFILFCTSILIYFCVSYLIKKTRKNFFLLVLVTILLSLVFPFLRTEFYFLPALFLVACLAPYFIIGKYTLQKYIYAFMLFASSLAIAGILFTAFSFNPFEALSKGRKGYDTEVEKTASAGSLGAQLIVNQPTPIRLLAGSLYMQIYPIPFWQGFSSNTIYDLYKTLNLFFIWLILPFGLLTISDFKQYSLEIKSTVLFSVGLYVIGTVAIAMSSLETRHLAIFYLPLLILASISNWKETGIRFRYKRILAVVLLAVACIHIAWIFLKFF